MAKTVFGNGREVAHQGNGGLAIGSPNMCWTPLPSPPGQRIPLPYSSVAQTKDISGGPIAVKVEGNMPLVEGAKVTVTTGDEQGKGGGISSGTQGGPAEPTTFSFDVKFEGRGVVRLGDSLSFNNKNVM